MTANDKDIVMVLRAALAERLGQDRFALWFGGGASLRFEHDTLIIAAADQFSLERLRKSFRADIVAACEETLGCQPTLDFRIEAELAPPTDNDADQNAEPETGGGMAAGPKPALNNDGGRQPRDQLLLPFERPRRRMAVLESFVVGPCNRVAYTAAKATPQRLGAASPMFVYGPTGCGKTHLLQGILSEVRRNGRRSRAVMLSAEQFTSHFLEALRGGGLPSFRHKYRDVDLLLIDDVQFFRGKRATLVELHHTIDKLLRDGRQIVLAADRPPSELSGLGPELSARMSGGLVAGIEAADRATRLDILRQLARQREIEFPEGVLQMIADRLDGDARQLGGALNRLQAASEAHESPITTEFAETALGDLFQATRRSVKIADVERAVCEVCGLDAKSLQSSRKVKAISHPRMLAMWLARKYTRSAYCEIGEYFGNRKHSTVISAEKKVTAWMNSGTQMPVGHGDCKVDEVVRRIEARLRIG